MSTNRQTNKFTRFLRNNAALLVMIFCIAAVITVVLAVSLSDNEQIPDTPVVGDPDDNNNNDDPTNKPVDPDDGNDDNPPVGPLPTIKLYFASPLNYKSVSMGYTNQEELFVFNPTLNCWSTHHGVDLVADDNTAVCAMFDGVVLEVTENYGMGNIVRIDHGDNVIATYASLADVKVVEGQSVTKGEQIGVVSTSASYEFSAGAHLHLEVAVNGTNVDPMPYVDGEIFREIEQEAAE